jgi:hypothetical protein
MLVLPCSDTIITNYQGTKELEVLMENIGGYLPAISRVRFLQPKTKKPLKKASLYPKTLKVNTKDIKKWVISQHGFDLLFNKAKKLNPSPVGSRVIILDNKGTIVSKFSWNTVPSTNNILESLETL